MDEYFMNPEDRARNLVASWRRGPYPFHAFDQSDPSAAIEIADIAAALQRYGDERAAQERPKQVYLVIGEQGEMSDMTYITWVAHAFADEAAARDYAERSEQRDKAAQTDPWAHKTTYSVETVKFA